MIFQTFTVKEYIDSSNQKAQRQLWLFILQLLGWTHLSFRSPGLFDQNTSAVWGQVVGYNNQKEFGHAPFLDDNLAREFRKLLIETELHVFYDWLKYFSVISVPIKNLNGEEIKIILPDFIACMNTTPSQQALAILLSKRIIHLDHKS